MPQPAAAAASACCGSSSRSGGRLRQRLRRKAAAGCIRVCIPSTPFSPPSSRLSPLTLLPLSLSLPLPPLKASLPFLLPLPLFPSSLKASPSSDVCPPPPRFLSSPVLCVPIFSFVPFARLPTLLPHLRFIPHSPPLSPLLLCVRFSFLSQKKSRRRNAQRVTCKKGGPALRARAPL